MQGYFGGWTDLLMQRFIEIWSSMPVLYILLTSAAILPPGFFILLGIMCSFPGSVSWRRQGRIPARPQFRICHAARALGVGNGTFMYRHCCRTRWCDAHLPALILSGSITTLTSSTFSASACLRSPSLGEMSRRASPTCRRPGWADRLLRHVDHAVAFDLRRRGDARRPSTEKDVRVSAT